MKTNKQIVKIFLPIIAVLLMGSCINQEDNKNVVLTFKYMSIVYDSSVTNFSFQEDPDYPNLVANYEVEKNHVISSLDLDNIGQLTKFIPHNQGGYYSRTGYYSEYLNPLSGSHLFEGYVCSKDITFYYSYTGGPAPIPEKVNFSFILLDIEFNDDNEPGFSFIESNAPPIFEVEFNYNENILQDDLDYIDDEISRLLEIDSQFIFGYYEDPSLLSNELKLSVGTKCLYDQNYFFGILD